MHTRRVLTSDHSILIVALAFLVPPAAEAQSTPPLSSPAMLRAPELLRACRADITGLRFNLFAQIMAPVYWFSPDEPLITPANRDIGAVSIPSRLPSANTNASPTPGPERVVYYRISRVRVRHRLTPDNRERFAVGPGLGGAIIPLNKVSHFHIRYLAYYPADIGVGQHRHDLEVVEVELAVEPLPSGPDECYVVRVTRIAGAAHGSDWYSNVLDVKPETDDLVLPPHILVEEGKHASAPDRNADGWFTPGYDATRNANDAWGVRDTIRENRLRSRTYSPTQAKDRCANPQIAVSRQQSQGIFAVSSRRRYVRENPTLTHCFFDQDSARFARYALLEAGLGTTAEHCDNSDPVTSMAPGLRSLLQKWDFCGRTDVRARKRLGSKIADFALAGPEGPGDATRRDRLTIAVRWAGGNNSLRRTMVSVVPGFGFRASTLGGGWLVPRVSIGRARRWSLDLMYTPSGSRIVDWYAAVGYDALNDTDTDGAAQEVGIKLRFPSGIFNKLNSLAGLRLGYRGKLHKEFGAGRFVLELGLGGW